MYREIRLVELPAILWECCLTNAVVLFPIATTSVFTFIMTYENVPQWLADNVFAVIDNRYLLLLVINLMLLFVTYVPESFMWLPRYFGFAR